MEERKWNRDLLENILALMQFLREQGVPVDQSASPENLALLAEAPALRAAYDMVCFMEEIPGGFFIYQAGGDEHIVYANKGLLHILRCENWPQFLELTGGTFRGLVYSEDLEAVEASIDRQISGSQDNMDYVEYHVQRRDGTVAWVEDYGHFVRSERAGDFFYVFLADATERREGQYSEKKKLEQQYQGMIEQYDRERSLINQEHLRRLEVIEGLSVDYESILYAELSQDLILAYRVSCRTRRQFGEKYRPKPLRWYFADYINTWVHPEDRELVARGTAPEYMRKKLAETKSYYINYRVVFEGETQYLQLRIVNVGGGDTVDEVVLGSRRVDRELQWEMQQKQLLAEALENANLAIEAKNEFLSNMSHDMRTPLNAIFGFTALAKQELQDSQTVLRYLERVETFGHQLLDLIDKVLEISWVGSNEAAAEMDCDLCKLVWESCDYMRPQAEKKGLEFTVDCARVRHRHVSADGEKLKQLMNYLISNAVVYTKPGGRVSVTIAEGDEPADNRGVYHLSVADTGIGISPEFMGRIFEPFARERNTTFSGVHGMGLGLTIAKYIVDRMGGTIDIKSTVGEGSTFTVTLFLRTLARTAEPLPEGEDSEPCCARRILLVEDNEINREIETEILRNGGFEVDTAEDGSIAVEKVKNSAPGGYDLILMDIQMPVMDGWQAARAIRELEDPELANIPIIALSANTLVGDMRRSMESGMDAHLTKPIDVPRFLEEVGRAARRHGTSRKGPPEETGECS